MGVNVAVAMGRRLLVQEFSHLDLEMQDSRGLTAMHWSARQGAVLGLDTLADLGANINVRSIIRGGAGSRQLQLPHATF